MSEDIDALDIDNEELDVGTDSTLLTAISQYQNRSYSQAINTLMPEAEADKSGLYLSLIGNCYQKLGSLNDATHYWQKAISKNPTCYRAFIGLGNVAYTQNQLKQALIYWHIALSINPENPQINYNLATAYSRKDDRFNAIYYYEKFIKYTEKQTSKDYAYVTKLIISLRNKAMELIRAGSKAIKDDKINHAVQFFIKAITNYPMIPNVVQNIAKIFACDRNFPKAIEYYKMAYKIDDKLKICLVDIANSYISLKEYDLAYCYFTRFLNNCNRNSPAFASVEKIAAYAQSKRNPDYNTMQHFQNAIEHENNLEYREALEEFENYKTLTNENEERVTESIKKLNLMVHPEKVIVKTLINKIEELCQNENYEPAIDLCDRVNKLAVLHSQEFMWANKKKQEIRYTIFRKQESKK